MEIGLQLYSVRNEMKKDPLKTIKKVADIGYKNIELANHNANKDFGCGFNVPAKELKKFLNNHDVKVVNTHILPCEEKYIDRLIEYHSIIGNNRLTIAIDFFDNKDTVLKKCEAYNKIGRKCRSAGMKFLYHNHFNEFQRYGNQYILDIIAENTDPELVYFELDTYWVYRAGVTIVDYVKKLGNRITLLHQKDFPNNSKIQKNILNRKDLKQEIDMQEFQRVISPNDFTEIGKGIMDIQEIINQASVFNSIKYIILEQDYTKLSEIESVTQSYNKLKEYTNIVY